MSGLILFLIAFICPSKQILIECYNNFSKKIKKLTSVKIGNMVYQIRMSTVRTIHKQICGERAIKVIIIA